MQAQAEEDEQLPRKGGARWGSASQGKGSMTMYNRDVQEKHKKRAESGEYQQQQLAGLKATASGRREERAKKADADTRSAGQKKTGASNGTRGINTWSALEVCGWLEKLDSSLNPYVPVFVGNEITGKVLLELSLDDLDYMEIKALGHRKIILKAVEELRRAHARGAAPTVPTPSKSTNMGPVGGRSPVISKSTEDIPTYDRHGSSEEKLSKYL
jgi:hypothetical protein